MPYLEVQLPTGHKDKVEVNANTLLIFVLEEVCQKRNMDVDYCYLTHNKLKLDLSVKFGMSNLINNSKLDLVISQSSLIENVTIDVTLQLGNGVRITNGFAPTDSFWSMLLKFSEIDKKNEMILFPEGSQKTPVILHNHDQIIGEYCLQHTTLAAIGLRFGRALFRYERKDVSEDEIIIQNETLNKKLQRNSTRKIDREKMQIPETPDDSPVEMSPSISKIRPEFPNVEPLPDDFTPFSMFPSNFNLFSEPPEKSRKSLREENQSPSLGDLLGISLDKDTNFESRVNPPNFMEFKFPEATQGQNLMDCEETPDLISSSHETRENVFYHRKPKENVVDQEEIPDSFFEVTEQDLIQILKRYRETAESDAPLMSKALKEQMREVQLAKYPRCIIQFYFQDAYILLSVFQLTEQIGHLYDYVRFYFQNADKDFHLYTTPPKEILKDKKISLIKSGLVPMSRVYVSVKASDLCSGNIELRVTGDHDNKSQELISKWMPMTRSDNATAHSYSAPSGSSGKGLQKTKGAAGLPKWFRK